MDLQSIKFFSAVADAGSFSGAADSLRYAQSNISTKIAALENELGVSLFYRNNRGVTLTPKGEELLLYSKKILALLSEAAASMEEDGTAKGHLHLGSLSSIAETHLPRLLTVYHQNNPKVELSVTTGITDELLASVLDRSLDAAFIAGNTRHPDLVYQDFKKEKLLLAAAQSSSIHSWQDITDQTLLVLPTGCYYRASLEAFLHEENILPHETITFSSLGSLLPNVCAGLGICLFPEAVLRKYSDRQYIKTFALPEKYAHVKTFLIYRKDLYLYKAMQNFIDLLCLIIN